MGETLINLFKFILFVLLLPVVIAAAKTFVEYFGNFSPNLKEFLLWGAEAFLVTFLFVHSFRGVYDFGQKMIEGLFKFLAPLEIFIASLIPFYTVLLLIALTVTERFVDLTGYKHYFLFFLGFTFCMHVTLVAQQLQEQEKSVIKPNYFLMMSMVFILNVFVAILFLDALAGQFTFFEFLKSILAAAWQIYVDVVHWVSRVK